MRTHLGDNAVLDSVVSRIERATPACARRWGAMNVHQMLVHIGDAAAAALGQRAFSATPRRGPRGLVRVLALYVFPRMPRGIKSGAEPASRSVDAAEFAQDRNRATQLLKQLAAPGQTYVPEHPAFGRMTRDDWLRYGYLHTDHHLRQFGL